MTRRSKTSPSSAAAGRARFRTEFGAALNAQLRRRGITQASIAEASGTSSAWISNLMNSRSSASPEWVEIVAGASGATPSEKRTLHRAAARDRGYKID